MIFHDMYGAVCIWFTYFSYDNCENTCTLSEYHHSYVQIPYAFSCDLLIRVIIELIEAETK